MRHEPESDDPVKVVGDEMIINQNKMTVGEVYYITYCAREYAFQKTDSGDIDVFVAKGRLEREQNE